MGRRKTKAKKVVKKKKMTVATQFKCLFCNHEGSVSCKMNTNIMIGELVCRICDAKFETHIHSLSDPIDVFSEWLDAADEQQQKIADSSGMNNAGFVGDGHDYVDDAPDDLGEEGDDDIVIDTGKPEEDDGLLDQLDAAETVNKVSQESSQVSSSGVSDNSPVVAAADDSPVIVTAMDDGQDDEKEATEAVSDDDDFLTADDSPKNVDVVADKEGSVDDALMDETHVDDTQIDATQVGETKIDETQVEVDTQVQ